MTRRCALALLLSAAALMLLPPTTDSKASKRKRKVGRDPFLQATDPERWDPSSRHALYAELEARDAALPCTLERREGLTRAEFEAEYLQRKPVLLVGGSGLVRDGELAAARAALPKLLTGKYAQHTVRTGRPEQLPRGLVPHTEKLVDFLRRPYTEENPYYLFQHDLLEAMPELAELFRQPAAIPEFAGRPIVSVGKVSPHPPPHPIHTDSTPRLALTCWLCWRQQDGSGLPFHEHAQTWSDLVIGRKRWSLFHATSHPLPPRGFSPMETQVQWLLGANYTELAPEQQPLECVQEPGDVVYLPDGWLHATVSLGPTIAFTRNSFDSTEGVGHYYHLDQFAIAVGRADEAAALAGAEAAPDYFGSQCYLAGAYNKVAEALLLQAEVGGEAERKGLVVAAYEKCVAANLANPMSYQAYADALMGAPPGHLPT